MENTLDILFNVIGMLGVSGILMAYFLMQLGKVSSKTLSYSLINLVGSILIMISLLRHWNLPSAIIEVCWISISLYGVYRALKEKRLINGGENNV